MPFVLHRPEHASPVLTHPMLPGGKILLDPQTEAALSMLVQWGYLAEPTPDRSNHYLLTPAGLDYAARYDGVWDGIDRRLEDRRMMEHEASEVGDRRAERRRVERRAS
jgi:hypothetical protein